MANASKPIIDRPNDIRVTSIRLLALIVAMQAIYFTVLIERPLVLIALTLLVGGLMMTAIYLTPNLSNIHVSTSTEAVGTQLYDLLPYVVILLAVFKIFTRSNVYLSSLSDGLVAARDILGGSSGSGSVVSASINVFLTPIWINLIAARALISKKHRNALLIALAVVPLIGVLDLVLFGARVTFAYQMAILFVAGLFTTQIVAMVGIFFAAAFIYVHATRASSLFQLGAEYLRLTSSGRTLSGIYDLSTVGLPDWWVGIAIFFQYVAHSISELLDLSKVRPLFEPTMVTMLDQLAILHIGNRADTQTAMANANPGNGSYQTFFGVFLVDFGLVGYVIAFMAIAGLVVLTHIARGQFQRVAILITATNLALAPIENFFVMGAGLFNFLLALAIASVFSLQLRNGHK